MMVAELAQSLHAPGYREILLRRTQGSRKGQAEDRSDCSRSLATKCFFPTIGAAVASYLKANNVEWEDWEDTQPR